MLMLPTRSGRLQHFASQGNAVVPVVIILVALSLSAAVFFFYTKKKMKPAESAVVESVENEVTPSVSVPLQVVPPPSKSPVFGFARPADLGAQLMRSLEAGDTETAAKLIAASQPDQEAMTKAVFEKIKELGYKTASVDQLLVVGQSGNSVRLSVPLLKADGTSTNARLLIDVQKDPKMGWKVSTLRLPKELEAALAAMPASPENVPAPALGTAQTSMAKPLILVEQTPDALTFASDFVQALLKPDYEMARKLVNEERVPSVKLAALCMVFEDGQYKLQANRPLMATVSTETTSWIIAKVQSAQRNEQTEFGIEMEKSTAGWSVIGLNLSQLLSDNAKPSTAAGVPYTPLVQNPKGGESIALYFEYDSNVLNTRAKKQLEIVAELLKASPAKKLRIGGHTDALGSDFYNVDLSKKRAESVKQFFLSYGVPPAQVETVAFGKANPLSPNVNADGTDNPDGRSRNRRAEILLDF